MFGRPVFGPIQPFDPEVQAELDHVGPILIVASKGYFDDNPELQLSDEDMKALLQRAKVLREKLWEGQPWSWVILGRYIFPVLALVGGNLIVKPLRVINLMAQYVARRIGG